MALQGRFDRAVKAYSEALRLSPQLASAHCNLGAVLAELGRRDEALAHLKQALSIDPENKDAQERLRRLYP
jgi:tetratricopeptide (TPR) repeat protein